MTTIAATAEAVAVDTPRYGGFWIRFVAAVIDVILVSIVLMPIGIAAALMLGGLALGEGMIMAVSWMVSIGGWWLYTAGFHSSAWQATIGKKVVGVIVTDEAGRRISFARASGRFFAEILSGLILLLGYVMAAFSSRKQSLHDKLASTLVVYGR